MLNAKFEDLKNYLKDKNILLTTHDSVDIDGFVSCWLFKYFLKLFFRKSKIFISFSEFSKKTKIFMGKVAEKFPELDFSPDKDVKISNIDLIIILDTNNLDQIAYNVSESDIPFIFIDHHVDLKKDYKNNLKSLTILGEGFSSTAEIIYDMFEYFEVELDVSYKYLLIGAILADSGHFKYGNNDTILRMSKLLDDKLDYQEIVSELKNKREISERIAKIKGIQRVNLIHLEDWLIGTTNISSYEASVANSLIQIGFDIGIAYSIKKSKFRITIRAVKEAYLKAGLNLGKVLKEVAKEYGGSGGGHPGAASLNGITNFKEILDKIIYNIKLVLNN